MPKVTESKWQIWGSLGEVWGSAGGGHIPEGFPEEVPLPLSCPGEGIGPVERRRSGFQAKETTYKGLEADQPGNLGLLRVAWPRGHLC